MPKPLSPTVLACLREVEAGRIKHIHPFTWVIHWSLSEAYPQAKRSLERLARERLILVDAGSREYMRDVTLTDTGRAALANTENTADA